MNTQQGVTPYIKVLQKSRRQSVLRFSRSSLSHFGCPVNKRIQDWNQESLILVKRALFKKKKLLLKEQNDLKTSLFFLASFFPYDRKDRHRNKVTELLQLTISRTTQVQSSSAAKPETSQDSMRRLVSFYLEVPKWGLGMVSLHA